MSKSLDFCKSRASNPEISNLSDRNWDDAIEIDVTTFVNAVLDSAVRKYELTGSLEDGTKVSYNVKVIIDPNADFDYFTSSSFLSDGTLIFLEDTMYKLLVKVLRAETYYKGIGKPWNGCTINWVIGNFVILNEYDGDWVPEDKKWMAERTTVLLPLKVWYGV